MAGALMKVGAAMTAGEAYHDPSPAEPRSGADARTREAVDEVIAADVTLGARDGEQELGAMTAKVAGNSLVQGVGKLLGYASGILTLALTTHLLTTTNFGDYTIANEYARSIIPPLQDPVGEFTPQPLQEVKEPTRQSRSGVWVLVGAPHSRQRDGRY
jgi:hypothetical protein